jgi:hypothetical protein
MFFSVLGQCNLDIVVVFGIEIMFDLEFMCIRRSWNNVSKLYRLVSFNVYRAVYSKIC